MGRDKSTGRSAKDVVGERIVLSDKSGKVLSVIAYVNGSAVISVIPGQSKDIVIDKIRNMLLSLGVGVELVKDDEDRSSKPSRLPPSSFIGRKRKVML